MKTGSKLDLVFIFLYAASLAVAAFLFGVHLERPWAILPILVFFYLAYQYDVRVPGLGSMNLDHMVAFPAVVLLGNPWVAAILGGFGILSSRIRRRGLGGLRPLNLFDALQVSISLLVGGWLFLIFIDRAGAGSLSATAGLLAAMITATLVNLGSVVLMRLVRRDLVPLPTLKQYVRQNAFWILLSFPFLVLLINGIQQVHYLEAILSGCTLLILLWALRLTEDMQQKHEALIDANRRQEFLQQLSVTSQGSMESEPFLTDLFEGLRDFIQWDTGVMMVLPTERAADAILVATEDIPADRGEIRKRLEDLLDDPELRSPKASGGEVIVRLKGEKAGSQLVAAIATSEIAFGILAVERDNSGSPFMEPEVRFLELALAQIAQRVQDEILKKQLLHTNRKLMQQTDYLSEILKISNLLKVHLEVSGILERVARGIRESMGFRYVLVSLYRESERCFERVAQAGLEDKWAEIREIKPPAEEILGDLDERFRVSNSYYISHAEGRIAPYDVVSPTDGASRNAKEGEWHPNDVLFVPLMDKDNRLLGIISLDDPVDSKVPSLETLRALEVLANQTVHALESAQVHLQIKQQAVMDGLTGLYNHRYFQEILGQDAREHTESGQPYSILMMDLDNFKEINDNYGHLVGDSLLRAVAKALTSCVRRGDIAARYGGEEFAVYLPGQDKGMAVVIAERVRRVVEGTTLKPAGVDKVIGVTLSIGLASFPQDGNDHQELLERADAALYKAKAGGKNRVFALG